MRLHCTHEQAFDAYDELISAMMGTNDFGGDTAEIYAYHFWPYDPGVSQQGMTATFDDPHSVSHEDALRIETNGRTDLVTLCRRFERRHGVKITIDGFTIAAWRHNGRYIHRAHVRVHRPEKGEDDA